MPIVNKVFSSLYLFSEARNISSGFACPRVQLFLAVKYYDKQNMEQHNRKGSCIENNQGVNA
jgi:hypothetical protein